MSWGTLFGQVASTAQTIFSSPVFSAFTNAHTLRTIRAEERFILHSQDLSTAQKLLPSTGIAIAGGATLVGLSSLIIGLPFWVPSLFFLSSVSGLAFDLSYYLAERSERATLRDAFINVYDLQKAINQELALSKKQKQILQDYSMGQSELILGLFELRITLINHKQLTLKNKQALIAQINQAIESIAQDKHFSLQSLQQNINFPELTFTLKRLTRGLHVYQQARRAQTTIFVSENFRKKINQYRQTHAKVFTLDLDAEDKDKLLKLLEDKTLNAPKIKLLLAQIGIRFLNHTAHQQVWLQDKKLNEYLIEELKLVKKIKTIIRFYQLPRHVAYHFHEIFIALEENNKLNARIKKTLMAHLHTLQQELQSPFCSKTMTDTWKEFSRLLVAHKIRSKPQLKPVAKLLSEIETVYQNAQRLINQQEDAAYLKLTIIKHRMNTLNQYVTGLSFKFTLPKCTLAQGKPSMLEKMASTLKNNTVVQEIHSLEDGLKNNVEKFFHSLENILFDGDDKSPSAHLEQKLQQLFAQNFGDALEIIQKAQRLKYLEMAAPRHFVNVGIDMACAAIAFGPPIALLQYLNYGLPVLSAANGLTLSQKTKHATNELNQGMADLTAGIVSESRPEKRLTPA